EAERPTEINDTPALIRVVDGQGCESEVRANEQQDAQHQRRDNWISSGEPAASQATDESKEQQDIARGVDQSEKLLLPADIRLDVDRPEHSEPAHACYTRHD